MKRIACWVLLALLFAGSGARAADEIQIDHNRLEATEDGYSLSVDLDFELPGRLEDALASGVPLFFLVEFEASRPRWYWFDERATQASLQLRLSYHALTRQFRLSSGALHQAFESLEEAQRALSRVRSWQVLARGQLRPGETYDCYLRVRLDVSQLPRPFQISAFANREWTLASGWKRWRFSVPVERPQK
jgi:Domain of unknown function (DUF4390)